jgi:hypothetical protein
MAPQLPLKRLPHLLDLEVLMHRCPKCRKLVASTHFLCRFSAKGGKTTGAKKARPSHVARRAALARWGKEGAP